MTVAEGLIVDVKEEAQEEEIEGEEEANSTSYVRRWQ